MNINTQIEALQRARQQSWGRINRYRLRLVLRYAGDSILDVGCATGMYVDYLNANGYEAWGLDLLAYLTPAEFEAQWREEHVLALEFELKSA